MEKIKITLTAYNMGAGCDEADFDAWAAWVEENLPEALTIDAARIEVDQHSYRNGPSSDTVTGGTEEERDRIRSWLAVGGWDEFCGSPEAWPKRA